jgi:hypothetical protein
VADLTKKVQRNGEKLNKIVNGNSQLTQGKRGKQKKQKAQEQPDAECLVCSELFSEDRTGSEWICC